MCIDLESTPTLVYRYKYTKLILTVIEADGEWVRINLDEVAPGSPIRTKRTVTP